MMARRQDRHSASIRQIGYYLCKVYTAKSYPAIGRAFGDRDHATVIHGYRKIKELRSLNAAFNSEIESMVAEIEKICILPIIQQEVTLSAL